MGGDLQGLWLESLYACGRRSNSRAVGPVQRMVPETPCKCPAGPSLPPEHPGQIAPFLLQPLTCCAGVQVSGAFPLQTESTQALALPQSLGSCCPGVLLPQEHTSGKGDRQGPQPRGGRGGPVAVGLHDQGQGLWCVAAWIWVPVNKSGSALVFVCLSFPPALQGPCSARSEGL